MGSIDPYWIRGWEGNRGFLKLLWLFILLVGIDSSEYPLVDDVISLSV